VGFIDETADGSERFLNGFPVLGDFSWFSRASLDDVAVICAVGTPSIAQRLVERATELGLDFATATSTLAWVATSATVGAGAMLFPHVVVNANAAIGRYATLNVAATVSHDSRIGDFCSVGPGAHVAGNVVLGRGCFVGMGANIIQGVSVGSGSVIGAGATVLADLPDGVTAVGTPARIVGPARDLPLEPHRRARAAIGSDRAEGTS
jgi:sugar O-acyltransferase (sialic acid O-acetyltransferase NeuD family)